MTANATKTAAMTASATATKLVAAALAAIALASCARHDLSPGRVVPAKRAAQATAQAPDVRERLTSGVRAFRLRRYADAVRAFDRAVAIDPRNVEARYDRARANEALRHWGAAASDLRIVTAARPTWTNARLQLAVARFHLRAYDRAAGDFDRVLRRDAHARGLWLDAGVSYFRARDYRRAAERFRHAVAIAPRSGRARLWLGMAYAREGKRVLARRELLLAARSHDGGIRRAARSALAAG